MHVLGLFCSFSSGLGMLVEAVSSVEEPSCGFASLLSELWACWLLGGMSRSHLPLEVPIGKLSRVAVVCRALVEWFSGGCEHF